jgi:hypothetical protein
MVRLWIVMLIAGCGSFHPKPVSEVSQELEGMGARVILRIGSLEGIEGGGGACHLT